MQLLASWLRLWIADVRLHVMVGIARTGSSARGSRASGTLRLICLRYGINYMLWVRYCEKYSS